MKVSEIPTVIYAIVVTYNGSQWLDKCFGSLVNSIIHLNIIAIDNASTDGTADIISRKFPEVEVIKIGENLGFGKANNIGLKRVFEENADFAFLLNQDAWIEPDTVEKLVAIANENTTYGIISPIQLNGEGNAIDLNFQSFLSNAITPGFLTDLYLNKLKPLYTSKYANAAAWLIRFSCIERIGGFDPLFKHYGEDDDYINRLHQENFKLGIVPGCVIYHDRPQEGKMKSKFYENIIHTQAVLEFKKNPKLHFISRRIVSNAFTLFLLYRGKNKKLIRQVRIDIKTLRFLIKNRRKQPQNLNEKVGLH